MTQISSLSGIEKTDIPGIRGTALLADDELSNRVVLGALLKKMGYETLQAEDGAQAVELFNANKPDIIFMDVMMPVMDGMEATVQIKKMCGDDFVPVIFLTAITDEKTLARCIEVGGDDFLTKPFSHVVLRSKIQAMERIRDLHREVSLLYGQQQQEQETAEKVFSSAVFANNVATDQVHILLKPAALFSGDVLLTAFTPTGDLHVLLGDFTGHGLNAALGALPVSETFRTMTSKGFSIEQILSEINRNLYNLLPTGMFLAAQFLHVSHDLELVSLYNCGMPDILVLDASGSQVKKRITSDYLPLGIIQSNEFEIPITNIMIEEGDRILLASDGVVEARSETGELYGQRRLEQIIAENTENQSIARTAQKQLEDFCGAAPQDDDISMVEIPCLPNLFSDWAGLSNVHTEHHSLQTKPTLMLTSSDILEISVSLHGPRLLRTNPVPLLINQIQELEDLDIHRRALYTILSELFVNALDHGVLGIDSCLKAHPDGFTRYFTEREHRLNELKEGEVRIFVQSSIVAESGEILIRVEDSGIGFDFRSIFRQNEQSPHTLPCGRGILLVKELCQAVRYEDPGNKVEALYRWSNT